LSGRKELVDRKEEREEVYNEVKQNIIYEEQEGNVKCLKEIIFLNSDLSVI
jgi:hypothetical protein